MLVAGGTASLGITAEAHWHNAHVYAADGSLAVAPEVVQVLGKHLHIMAAVGPDSLQAAEADAAASSSSGANSAPPSLRPLASQADGSRPPGALSGAAVAEEAPDEQSSSSSSSSKAVPLHTLPYTSSQTAEEGAIADEGPDLPTSPVTSDSTSAVTEQPPLGTAGQTVVASQQGSHASAEGMHSAKAQQLGTASEPDPSSPDEAVGASKVAGEPGSGMFMPERLVLQGLSCDPGMLGQLLGESAYLAYDFREPGRHT